MKKIILIGTSALFIFCISCKKQYTGVFSPIKFTPEKIIFQPIKDTIETSSNKWIDITYGQIFPVSQNGNLDQVIRSNETQDTLTIGWMKAIALNRKENDEYIMKVISLEENNTGKDRSYIISVGNGPFFGSLVVTQLAE